MTLLNRRTSTTAGGILLIAWGILHIAGGFSLRHDGSDPVFIPGWDFMTIVVLGSLLTVAAGVAYLTQRRWACAAGALGVAWLWVAPILFVALRFGWSSLDPLHHVVKLAVSGALIAVPVLGRPRSAVSTAQT